MLTSHGPHAMTHGQVRPTEPGIEQRSRASRARARRRWALRSGLLLLLTAIMLCLLVVWRRDQVGVSEHLRAIQPAVAAMQARIDRLGMLPYAMPDLEGCYYASEVRFFAQDTTEPVIIAYGLVAKLILRPDGRTVVIYEDGKVRAEWMPESAFQDRWFNQARQIEQFEERRRARPPELP